jgi:hypothetical protein
MIKVIIGAAVSLSLLPFALTNIYSSTAKSDAIAGNDTDKVKDSKVKEKSPAPQLLADSSNDPNFNDGIASDSLGGMEINRCGNYFPMLNKGGTISDRGIHFNNAGDFSEGLARVPFGKKCGYINTTSKLVIPAKFDFASDFSQGLAAIKTNGKWGYIDRSGNIAIAPQFDRVASFDNGLAIVQSKGKQGFIDRTGKPAIPLKFHSVSRFQDGLALVKFNGKYGYIDLTGKFVIPPQFTGADDFHEGVARIDAGSNGVYFIDRTGRRITKPGQFSSAFAAQDGLIAVSKTDRPGGKELWGFIDLSGKQIIPFKFDGIDSFQEGLAVVVVNDKYGYIDRTGKFAIPPRFAVADSFRDGLARVIVGGDKNQPAQFGYIDKTGKMIIPPTLDFGVSSDGGYFYDDRRQVYIKDKWGFIDKVGKLVIPAQFDNVYYFSEGFAKVEINNKWAYIDKSGKILVQQSSQP